VCVGILLCKENKKIKQVTSVGLSLFNYQDDARSNKHKTLSQHVSGIIMPIFRRSKSVLLYMVYCAGSAGCGW